jgi:hypothetical protein
MNMAKVNELEKSATLWRDNSEFALRLQKQIEDRGYNLRVVLTGGATPMLSCPGHLLSSYRNIHYFIDR